MKIVLIGGNGFIGRSILRNLDVPGNRRVVVFDRSCCNTTLNNVEYISGDLHDKDALDAVIEEGDCVIHLGCTSVPVSSNFSIGHDATSNLLTTINLLDVCAQKRIGKFIFASSGGGIYGKPQYIPIDEVHPTEPLSIYGVHKLTIEKYLSIIEKKIGIDTVCLRIANPYGVYQRPFTGQGVIATFLASAIMNRPVSVWGDGTAVRDYIYIDDLCDLFNKVIAQKNCSGIYNVGSGYGTSISNIIKIIEEITDKSMQVEYKEVADVEVNCNILDCRKASNRFRWKCGVNIRDGIECIAKEWSRNGIPE